MSISISQILELHSHLIDSNLSSEKRQQYEKQLELMQLKNGYLISSLQICTTSLKDVPLDIALAVAVQFRRVVLSSWALEKNEKKEKIEKISFEEKKAIRQGIFPALLHVPPSISAQLLDAFRIIARTDYPSRWPAIFSEIGRVLKTTTDLRSLALTTRCLLLIVKNTEFAHAESPQRAPLNAIVEASFPTLLAMATRLCEVNAAEARDVQRWVVRLFYLSLNMSIPPFFLKKFENFSPWMDLCFKMLALPLPPGEPTGTAEEEEARAEWSPWKLRKWIFHVFNRLFTRYGASRPNLPQELKSFSQKMFDTYARKMLQADVMYLGLFRKHQFLPQRLLQALIAFLDNASRSKPIWGVLKDKMLELLIHVVFPLLCFGPKDLHRWREDPSEYVRSGSDLLAELNDPRHTALLFLQEILKKKHDEMLLYPFIDFLKKVFKEFVDANMDQTLALAGRFNGALVALGCIHDTIIHNEKTYKQKKKTNLRDEIKQLLRNVFVPAITSKFPFVRAQILSTFSNYLPLFAHDKILLPASMEKVIQLTNDPELPVKVEAIAAVQHFIEYESCRPVIRRNLPLLIDLIFTLFDSLDHDCLINCLQAIIIKFADEILPFATGLISRFTTQFQRLIQKLIIDEETESVSVAIDEILRAITAVLAAVHKHPEIYAQNESSLVLITQRVFTQDCIDYFEYGAKILSLLTFFSPQIPEVVWEFYIPLMQMASTWAQDFTPEIVSVLDNFITKGQDILLSPKAQYLDNTMRFIELIFQGKKQNFSNGEHNCLEVAKLISTLLQGTHLQGKIDQYISNLIHMILARLETCHNRSFKLMLFSVLSDAFFYNAGLAISTLEKKKCTKKILQLWISAEPTFSKLYHMKIMVIGISAIFRLPLDADKAPIELQAMLPDLLKTCLKLLNKMKSQAKQLEESKVQRKNKNHQKLFDHDDDPDDQDEDVDDDDEEENANDIDQVTLAEIRELQEMTDTRLNENYDDEYNEYDDQGVFEDDEEEEDYLDSEEDKNESSSENLMDQTNERVYFATSWNQFSQNHPAIQQKIYHESLDENQKKILQENLIKLNDD